MVQACEKFSLPSEPILIKNKTKKFIPGELSNFWSPDSS
jgi:hypothetical protein